MCPYSCEWGEWKSEHDCDKPEDVSRKIKEEGLGWTFNETLNCFHVPIAEDFERKHPKNWETLVESVYNKENWITDDGEIYPDFMRLPKKMRDRLPQAVRRRRGQAWVNFVHDYVSLTSKTSTRSPRGKIIDPVFGGTNCYKYEGTPPHGTNYTLTRITEYDPQAEGWNRVTEDDMDRALESEVFTERKSLRGACNLPLCAPNFKNRPNQLVQGCGRHMWTRWGEWGQCNQKCGSTGERTRKRKCTLCGRPKGEHNPHPANQGDCKPTATFDGSEGLKDTDKAQCSPCPSDSFVGWADWGEWSTPDKFECGTTAKQHRARKCNEDYRAALEDEGDQKTCKGMQKESRVLKNKCEQ